MKNEANPYRPILPVGGSGEDKGTSFMPWFSVEVQGCCHIWGERRDLNGTRELHLVVMPTDSEDGLGVVGNDVARAVTLLQSDLKPAGILAACCFERYAESVDSARMIMLTAEEVVNLVDRGVPVQILADNEDAPHVWLAKCDDPRTGEG